MTSFKKRSRLGIAVAATVLSLASIIALAAPASALVAPDPPVNVTATGGTNQITVKWSVTTLPSGDPATDYIISVEKAADPLNTPFAVEIVPVVAGQVDYEKIVTGLPAGTYRVVVRAHNNSPIPYNLSAPVIVQPITVTTVSPVSNTAPFRPYASWEAMINREYQMWTGCGANGRLPRLDELTFWRYSMAIKPFTVEEDYQLTYGLFNGTYTFFKGNLLASMAPISVATVNDIYAGVTPTPYVYGTNPPAIRALADTNNNGIIETSELNAAVNAAYTQAVNDVFFSRRAAMAITLAEGAEQTDGPAIRLYTAYFKRDVDMGACYWSNQIKSAKMSLLQVSNFFVNSSEFVNTYGAYSTDADEPGTDAAEFVALIYANVLDRDPEAAGFAYWTRQLQSQRKSPAEVMIGFSESSEFKNKRALSTGVAVGYIHLLGRTPTAADYTFANVFGLYLNTSPECGWSFWGCWPGSGFGYNGAYSLYTYLIGTTEYATRAAAA